MAVTNELKFPPTEELFEEMCFHLYKSEWKDPGANRLGGTGQAQKGLDLMGTSHGQEIGVQCKHYVRTEFTMATVGKDLAKLDQSGQVVDLVIFATTAANKSQLVFDVRRLSAERRAAGKCAVTVHFWSELSGMLRKHPDVARQYIPDFPGSTQQQTKELAEATLVVVQRESANNETMRQQIGELYVQFSPDGLRPWVTETLPTGAPAESPVVAKQLDLAGEKLKLGRPDDVHEALQILGDPDRLKEAHSRFRWHTLNAARLLVSGQPEPAAREYLKAAAIQPELEKALRNKALAHLLLKNPDESAAVLNKALEQYPESTSLWGLHIAVARVRGAADPATGVPTHLVNTVDVLFALSGVRSRQGQHEEAVDLMDRCLKLDTPTLEVRRTYLSTALSWALADPAGAEMGQLTPKQRSTLLAATSLFEPIETQVLTIQGTEISLEVSSNLAVSYHLLDELQKARALARAALVRHPRTEALLRLRINELRFQKDVSGLKALLADGAAVLPGLALAELAEAASGLGESALFEQVTAELQSRDLTERQRQEVSILGSRLQWTLGDREKALELAREHVAQFPNHVLGHAALVRMLTWTGRDVEAALETPKVEALVAPERTSTLELVQVADLLQELCVHDRAAELYARVVTTFGEDPLTYHYLNCLIESDQRLRAQQIFDKLPEAIRVRSDFRRLEANLARRKGDWKHTAELLRIELNQFPRNATVAVNYVGALHRLNKLDESLQQYLATKPVFDGLHPVAEAEIAKYEVAHGLRPQALRRLYSLMRNNPQNTRIAGYFLAQLHIGELPPEMATEIREAGAGVVAVLKAGGEELVVAVDFEAELAGGWTGMVGADSNVAMAVRDKGVGDVVSLNRGFGRVDFTVVSLYSVYGFAMQHAELLLRSTADHEGPAWSVNIAAADGGLDLEVLSRPVREKEARVVAAFKDYEEMRFPLSTLAKRIGTSPLELVLGWRVDLTTMFVALGTEDEQAAHQQLLQAKPAVVLDLPTLGELVALKAFRHIAPLFGRPLVPAAVRDELVGILDADLQFQPQMALQEDNGQITRVEYTETWHQSRLSILREMLACIDELCEVTPVLGPEVLGPGHRVLEMLLDDATLDAVYLAVERNAVLVTDDAALRLVMAQIDNDRAVCAQAVLAYARGVGAVSDDLYVDALSSKLLRGQDFISISGADLTRVARRTPREVSEIVLAGLRTLQSASLNVLSGIKVIAQFSVALMGVVPPSVLKRYFEVALEAFRVHQSPQIAHAVHVGLAQALTTQIEHLPRKQAMALRRELGVLLKPPPKDAPEPLRLTAAALAAKTLLHRIPV